MSDVKNRLEKLKKLINHHRYLYHVLDKQEISDAALDSLKHELYKLEQEYPEYVTPDSPTQRVGGAPLDKFNKITHAVRQWSFEDVFTEEEVRDFDERVKKMLTKSLGSFASKLEYACELKIDGFKIILTYEKGLLKTAATRGDGIVGEDVTQNVKTIESIPLRLEKDINIVVEGEIWMSKTELKRLNKEQEKKGLPPFANPRNAAAGSIRQLDSKIAASRKLDSFIYDVASIGGVGESGSLSSLLPDTEGKSQRRQTTRLAIELLETQLEELKLLEALGFKVNKHYKLCKNIGEVIEYWQKWQRNKETEDYWIDGIVLKLNKRDWQERLGYTGKAPRFAVAFKFPAEQTTTVVENIIVQVGRTGALTPVAVLEPVLVAGSTVTRATLHNASEIKRLGLKIGDAVIIQKAGDIIPEVVKVLKELRAGKEKDFKMPVRCPVCGGRLEREKDSPIIKCANKKCSSRRRGELYYFASKKGFNIDGLGPKIIDALVDSGLVQDAADFFDLKEGDLVPLERFAEKSAQNIIEAISKSKSVLLAKFITALSIEHVGEETARLIAQQLVANLKSKISKLKNQEVLKHLQNYSVENLEKVNGIGPKVAQSFYGWFKNEQNKNFLGKLLDRIIIITPEQPEVLQKSKIASKVFVLTGSLASMSRDKAKEEIIIRGGHVIESVSKKTDFVVAGGEPGSKYGKAKKLGVKIINEKEFLKLID